MTGEILGWLLLLVLTAGVIAGLRLMPIRKGRSLALGRLEIPLWRLVWTSLLWSLCLLASLIAAAVIYTYAWPWVTTLLLWIGLATLVGDIAWLVRKRRLHQHSEVLAWAEPILGDLDGDGRIGEP